VSPTSGKFRSCRSANARSANGRSYECYRERAAVDRSDRYIQGSRQKLVGYGPAEAVGSKTNRRYVASKP
jgi:hypothetical protein